MIVTLTVNPSLDRTIELGGALARGAVQRATASSSVPAGKGVNVSRALTHLSAPTVAVFPARPGSLLVDGLHREDVTVRIVPIDAESRSNITVTEPDGTTTKLNEVGPVLDAATAAELTRVVVDESRAAEWLVLAGSLAPGLPVDFYVHVIDAVRRSGSSVRIAVDSSGPALSALLTSGAIVDLIKPNSEELAELTGHPDSDAIEHDPGLAAELAERVVASSGIRAVLATLGANGAVLTGAGQGSLAAGAPRIVARSTVGAGDSSLAGYLFAAVNGLDAAGRLTSAVAHGAAAASLPGSQMPSLAHIDPSAIRVTPILPGAALHPAFHPNHATEHDTAGIVAADRAITPPGGTP